MKQFGGANGVFASGRPEVNTTHISGDQTAADNAESLFDGTGYGPLLRSGPVGSVTSQTQFGILGSAGEGADGAWVDSILVLRDSTYATTGGVKYFRVTDFDNAEDEFIVQPLGGTGGFMTVSVGDTVDVYPPSLSNQLVAVKTKTDFLPSATAGTAGGVFIAGSNANTTVNFTGDLSGSMGSVNAAVTTSAASNQAIAAADRAVLFTGTVANAANTTTDVFATGGGAALPAEVAGQLLIITHSGKLYVREIVGFTGGGDAVQVAALPFTPASGDALAILAVAP